MPYPLSSSVVPGDPTAATHYNNLRADALYLGQSSADAVSLGSLLERYESRLKIQALSTDKVRVPASASEPASLMIGGYLCQATANVDLADADRPSGGVSTWYIFAKRAPDSNSFTLSVSTSPTELENTRRIGRFYWDSAKIVRDSIRTDFAIHLRDLLFYVDPAVCGGRLSAATFNPVAGTDVASSNSIYFTPFVSNNISLFVQDYGWRIYKFTELSYSLAGIAANKNLDIFIFNDNGTLKLTHIEWSSDSIRSSLLAWQEGVLVKINDPSYRYLGTIRTSAANTVADTRTKRFVWNYYNQVPRSFRVFDNTSNWTYNVRAWRPWNNNTANRAEFVVGFQNAYVDLLFTASGLIATAGNFFAINLGLDSESDPHANNSATMGSGTTISSIQARFAEFPTEGYHYLQLLEIGGNAVNATFYGQHVSGATVGRSVANGFIFA